MHNNFFFCVLLLLLHNFLFAQEKSFIKEPKKMVKTEKTISLITIDGQLDEKDWTTVLPAKDFYTFAPDNGNLESKELRTEVKILYDDNAIYIGATLYDSDPSKILKEITERDDIGTADSFGVFINGYNDGQQDFQF